MNRNEAITGLAEYALDKELIRPEEKIWAVNSLLDVLEIDTYSLEELQKNETINLTELLDVLLDDAYERGVLTENSVVYRDLLDTKLMGCLTPRPSQVMDRFAMLGKNLHRKRQTGIISSVRTQTIFEKTVWQKTSGGRQLQSMVIWIYRLICLSRRKIRKL